MSKKLRELDHQVNLRNAELETEKANVLDEDKSKAKIKEVASEIEKILAKYNCTITPMLQILDQSYENAIINKTLKEKAEVITK